MQTMSKQQFLALASESLIFAQIKAEAFGVTRAQVDLWSANYQRFERNAGTGLLLPVQKDQLTKQSGQSALTNRQNTEAGRVHTQREADQLIPHMLRRQAF